MSRWLYYLLITAIIAPLIALIWGPQQEMAIFMASAISLVPLAALIGRTTEDLAYYVGPIAGGLLNATFGNAPELIIGIFALQAGLISVVKASLTGSIISNILFVLGGSLALGGWRWGRQYFSARDAGQYSAMLVLAMAGLLIPAASTLIIKDDAARIQSISVAIAIILLLVYLLYLALHVFHVHSTRRTPRHKGKTPPPPPAETEEGAEEEEVNAVTGGLIAREVEEPRPPYPWLSGLVLLVATVGTAWNSELLVGAIKPVTAQLGWSQTFIGLVIIPIAGNAAEHTSAVYIAYKDRVDLSMAIAAGSAIQVATLVAPLLVLLSLFMGGTRLNLVFQPVELIVLGLATILFTIITLEGESTWLSGIQLVAIYIMACVVFFLIPG